MQNIEEYTLKLKGKAFDDGYNLYYLSKGLSNFNSLIDKSYLTIKGKNKLTEKDREYYKVVAHNLRAGSFETDFFIYVSTITGSLVPIVSSMSPSDIWNLVKQSFIYLNTVLAGNSKGETYSLQADNGSNINVINGDGALVIQITPDVLRNANKSFVNFNELSRMVDPNKGVESISVLEKNTSKEHLHLGVEEKLNFENKKRLDPEPIEFIGMIIRVDGEGFDGRLRVIDGNGNIPNGDYRFEFIIKDDPEKLRRALMNNKKIIALKETVLDISTLEQKIVKLRILDVK